MPVTARCLYCKESATILTFYSKTYPSGKSTIETPIFSCPNCLPQAKTDLNICRGGIEGIKIYTFKQLGAMKEKEIGYLTSKRGYELNHLATREYRQLLFSIHYQNRPSKKEILKEHLVWYQRNLESRIGEGFDEKLLSLLDSTKYLLENIV